MEDCIFCKIIKGELPSFKVYEDNGTFAFLTIEPVNKGHTLVVTKNHYRTFIETPDNVVCDLMAVAKKIGASLKENLGAEGINFSINNDKTAGQEVPHTHIHVIPRFETDEHIMWPHTKYEDGEGDEVAKKIGSGLL